MVTPVPGQTRSLSFLSLHGYRTRACGPRLSCCGADRSLVWLNQFQARHSTVGAPVPSFDLTPQTSHPVVPTSASGPGGVLSAPTTELTSHCNILSECISKADELKQQMKAQAAGGSAAQIMPQEAMDEFMDELKSSATQEVTSMVTALRSSPAIIQKAGIHELRRTLFYAVQLKDKNWIDEGHYIPVMRMLTVEFLRRDNEGALTPDDVLYISTHIVASNFYNRHLWNRMEGALFRFKTFENIDMATVKGLSTKLFKTRPGSAKETHDVRRKILNAMAKRVGVFANEFDLPTLLGILQCYTTHGLLPHWVEPLAHRAINHIGDFTPVECATLAQILRKWKLMRLEICEKLIERICTAETLTAPMAQACLGSIKLCFSRISEGGRNAASAEPTKQKLRALGEQVGARLDEVEFTEVPAIIAQIDTLVQLKIFVPRRCMQHLFNQANEIVTKMIGEGQGLTNAKTGKTSRILTAEEARQLMVFLQHYGADLNADLNTKLKQALKDGIFPDEASLLG